MAILGISLAFVNSAQAAEVKWTGATDSKWSTTSNWTGGFPTSSDTVQVGTGHHTYTNGLIIQDGDNGVAGIAYFNGGEIKMTGGSLTVTNNRLRIGNTAPTNLAISGGTLNLNGGFGIGAGDSVTTPSTITISGTARVNISKDFIIHGNRAYTMTQSGGVVVNKCSDHVANMQQIGEGPNEANLVLTGGAFYNTNTVKTFFVGQNMGKTNAGKGQITISGGQFYVANALQLGNDKSYDQNVTPDPDKYGRVILNSGILSAKNITFGVRQGELQLNGGTFVTSAVTGDLTNKGSAVEIADAFAPTEEQIDGLADNETWFSKYQKGKIGTLDVSGTYTQTAGSVVIDISNATTYDKLTANSFNVTGGNLNVNVNDSGITKEMAYAVFGDNPSGNLNFSKIIVNGNVSSKWKIMNDGKLVRIYAEEFKWTGSESGDWNTRANWNANGSNYAPESLDTVQVGTYYNAYTNELTIKDGDNVQAGTMNFNGGKMSVTGGNLTVTSNRWRIGNTGSASSEVNISGGTINLNKGLAIGASQSDTIETSVTVEGDARLNIKSCFCLHGYNKSTLTQNGGVIFVDTSTGEQFSQIGEAVNADASTNAASVYSNGGAFYNVTNLYVGRNKGNGTVGKGLLSVDGGQIYVGDTLVIGSSLEAEADRYGIVEVKSGILSAKTISFGTKTGELKLEGGKFVAQKVNGDLVNVGSTVEIAANFTPTEAQVNGLTGNETWYSKYQKGTVGTLTVTGTYKQTGGALELDLVDLDSYDVLNVGNFDVTSGDLQIKVSDSLARMLQGGESFSVFGANPSGTLDFSQIIPNFGNSSQWVLGTDGVLTYYNSNQIPEPSAWLLLLMGASLIGISRKFKVHKS